MAVTKGSISVDGMRELNRSLTALGAGAELGLANYEAGKLLVKKARIPVRTGALKASVKVSKAKNVGKVTAGNARVPYANPIHWGWFYDREYFIKKNIMPNPFFSQALKYNYQEILDKYETDMRNLIKRHNL